MPSAMYGDVYLSNRGMICDSFLAACNRSDGAIWRVNPINGTVDHFWLTGLHSFSEKGTAPADEKDREEYELAMSLLRQVRAKGASLTGWVSMEKPVPQAEKTTEF